MHSRHDRFHNHHHPRAAHIHDFAPKFKPKSHKLSCANHNASPVIQLDPVVCAALQLDTVVCAALQLDAVVCAALQLDAVVCAALQLDPVVCALVQHDPISKRFFI